MKASLNAATSLTTVTSVAAVLALSSTPSTAGPRFDLSVSSAQSICNNVVSPSTCTLSFFALPGGSATTQTLTMTGTANNNKGATFPNAPAGFTGTTKSVATLRSGNTFTSNAYGFNGGLSAGPTGKSAATTGTVNATSQNGANIQTSPLTFNGLTVAPIESVSGKNAGFVLVGSSGSASVTVTNAGQGNLATGGAANSASNLKGTVGAGDLVFAGSGGSLGASTGLADAGSQTFTYTYAPTVRGSQNTTITTTFTNGNASGNNTGQVVNTTIGGQGVAPVQQVTTGPSVLARAGGSSVNSTVTVANIGDGNLATKGPNGASNLNGTIGAITGSANWSGGPTTFSIQDNTSAGPNSSTFAYTYGPGTTRSGPNTGNVSVAFSNGNSNGTNTAQTVDAVLIGNTVGPVYQSQWPGSTVNTPGKNGGTPTGTIDFGTVVSGKGAQTLTLANISTDPNGEDTTLTDLTIEAFSISGTNSADFSIGGKQSGGVPVSVLHEGASELIGIDFATLTEGTFNALLTFTTDEGAAFGGAGNFYTYALTAVVPGVVPEPTSLLLLGVGLGGVLVARKGRQRARRFRCRGGSGHG